MTFDDIMTDIKDQLNDFLHSDWLGSLLILIAVVIVTLICSKLMRIAIMRILKSDKGPVPQATIFINIGRFVIWSIGICIILSTCFGVNVQAAITALGIGGIAISLGFQSTLSNLIGGLQIVLGGIIEPGDRIKISNYHGVVSDITWRHTCIVDPAGETVVVPNSLINSSALVKLHPQKDVRLTLLIEDSADAFRSYIDAHADLADKLFDGSVTSAASSVDSQGPVSSGSGSSTYSDAAATITATMNMSSIDAVTALIDAVVDQELRKIGALKEGAGIDVISKDKIGYTALLSFVVNVGLSDEEIDNAVSEAIKGIATILVSVAQQQDGDSVGVEPGEKGLFRSWTKKEKDPTAALNLRPDSEDRGNG